MLRSPVVRFNTEEVLCVLERPGALKTAVFASPEVNDYVSLRVKTAGELDPQNMVHVNPLIANPKEGRMRFLHGIFAPSLPLAGVRGPEV
jgi:hypothetical protein